MQELNVLNDKLDTLLKKYAELKAENKRLRETVGAQLGQVEKLTDKLTLLEQNVMAASIGTSSVLNDKDKEVVKKQLDTVLGEIDKILATLND